MKNNRLYMPVDAIERHEDFDIWYEDGTVALTFRGEWSCEKDKVSVFTRMGGENAFIRPDHNTLAYYLRIERWEYILHTYRVFQDYFIEGMRWEAIGSLTSTPFDFVNVDSKAKDARIQRVKFKDKGDCYELKVKDLNKLRIAAVSMVAIAIKEHYKGKSEGIIPENETRLQKIKRQLKPTTGITYEELLREEEAAK